VLGNLMPKKATAMVGGGTRVKRVAEPPTVLDGVAKLVFEDLRRVRSELAKEHDLPAYIICHDKTLALIATERPQTPEALERVKGFGPHKVRLYGEKLLEVLNGQG
jgi:superfamily II DNA helicase RecQ